LGEASASSSTWPRRPQPWLGPSSSRPCVVCAGQSAAAAARGPGLLLPEGNVWCPGCWPGPSGWQGRVSALVVTCWAGRVPVLRNPANGNRAVPLPCEQSDYGVANAAAAHRRRAGPHRALASLSIRA
jgi:hypothetical protein